jgi:predicted S18 family serine protease
VKTVFSTLLIVLLISASPVYAQAPRATSSDKTNVVGQVVDSYERVPIRSAFVVIHSEGGQEDQVVTVDPKGDMKSR